MRQVTFTVPGTPRPGGSKISFIHPVTRKAMAKEFDPKGYKALWRSSVSQAAAQAMDGQSLFRGACRFDCCFSFARPKSHFGTGRNAAVLKPGAPQYPARPADLTKLVRLAEDAMLGIVFVDDGQVVQQSVEKVWAPKSGAVFTVTEL
jgi:Holliday junction resolvase RusA-like endonuclease